MAVPCVFVPACLMAGEETCAPAVTEALTIALEHLTGNKLKRSTFTFYTDVTYFSFGSCTQRRPLFFMEYFFKCGQNAVKATTAHFETLACNDGSQPLIYSDVLVQRQDRTYLLQPLWTFSSSAGAVPSTDALVKGIFVVAAERGGKFKDFFFLNSQTLQFIAVKRLLQSLGGCVKLWELFSLDPSRQCYVSVSVW